MNTLVRPMREDDRARWDAFVDAHPDATFFHRAGWAEAIERGFGHRTRYALAERNGELVGVLPLTEIKSRVFGHALISNAFSVQGGPLAADEAALTALTDHARDQLLKSGATRLELRCKLPGFTEKEGLYAIFRRQVSSDADANLKAIPRKQRAVLRKALETDLEAHASRDWATCHRVYAESVRNLGSPVFPKAWFKALLDVFGDAADVTTVHDRGIPIASVLSFWWRGEVLPYYGGGTPAARGGGYDLLYWSVLGRLAEQGGGVFDFGRSKVGTGAYSFKKNWGFEPTPLTYSFQLPQGQSVPDLNPLNPKFRLFIAAWKRLPLPVANALGPLVVRNLG
jgi:FemAB-related protein (PEP-CTERM system-associated)